MIADKQDLHNCGRKEWIPVNSFSPDINEHSTMITCQGTVVPINTEKTKWQCTACDHITGL